MPTPKPAPTKSDPPEPSVDDTVSEEEEDVKVVIDFDKDGKVLTDNSGSAKKKK